MVETDIKGCIDVTLCYVSTHSKDEIQVHFLFSSFTVKFHWSWWSNDFGPEDNF